MGELSRLKGLGPKSERRLNDIGVQTRADLERLGPVQAFLLLRAADPRTSLNFLYAMVGALADRHWTEIARADRHRLLNELDGIGQLEAMLGSLGDDT